MKIYVIVEKSESPSYTYRRVCGVGFKKKEAAERFAEKNCLNPEIVEIEVYE